MKNLLLIALLFPVLSFSQISHYDSLYNAGLINHADYMILRQTYAKPNDSTTVKLNKYDSLYKAKQITEEEYKLLKQNLFATAPIPVKPIYYDPQEDRTKARKQTIGGAILLLVGTGLTSGFIYCVANNYAPVTCATLGVFGVGFTATGIGLLGHGGYLRRNADRYERDKQLLGK